MACVCRLARGGFQSSAACTTWPAARSCTALWPTSRAGWTRRSCTSSSARSPWWSPRPRRPLGRSCGRTTPCSRRGRGAPPSRSWPRRGWASSSGATARCGGSSARSASWSCSARVACSRSATSGRRRWAAVAASSSSGEAVNVSERISTLITDSTMRAMIGDRFERTEEFMQTLEVSVKLVSGFNLGDLFPSSRLASFISGTARLAEENHRKSFELMEYAIKQHEGRRDGAAVQGEDLVDVLLRIQKEGGLEMPLTMGVIKAVILDLFNAGSETSATTLQWAMSELMRYPNVNEEGTSRSTR